MSTPPPDPMMIAERQRATNERRDSIQERLAARTAQFMRRSGSRRSLNGGSKIPSILTGA